MLTFLPLVELEVAGEIPVLATQPLHARLGIMDARSSHAESVSVVQVNP